MEFGIVFRQGFSALHESIPCIFEDGENELPNMYRPTLQLMYEHLNQLREDLKFLDDQIKALFKQKREHTYIASKSLKRQRTSGCWL
jgi:transposase